MGPGGAHLAPPPCPTHQGGRDGLQSAEELQGGAKTLPRFAVGTVVFHTPWYSGIMLKKMSKDQILYVLGHSYCINTSYISILFVSRRLLL